MQLQTGNLFSVDGRCGGDERIDLLVTSPRVNVERIVSMGHASPDGFWYDDARAEWVVLLSGAAVLEFEEDATRLDMRAGDYVLIEPHCRHRVAWTHDEVQTVWLAVYYER
ncbi:cupin domain-containing protein [Burkholderia cenocepacia]|uniref:cupin domain-containing protein n=1 Tax=Burkholderia cepacia complex TaxID=87882 RepID=UPI001BA11391|nr:MULTISPECIES: cupin domain-containing protein [Burkholderia cepacia complex]MBR8379573.1 cupin domain-containing protein [Burkholderia cenocepacia]MDN7559284.1 cupin domain-containing protein [Burkholderia orbicola]